MSHDPSALLQRADKAAASANSGFSFFGSKTEKWENAADLYTQAANQFRLQNLATEAGQAFEKASQIQLKHLSEPDDAATSNLEAYKAYRRASPTDAARCLSSAINHYTSKGNFRRAATHMQNLGELYEELSTNAPASGAEDKEMGKKARECYEKAAQWFEMDGAEALAGKLVLKTAELKAVEGDWYGAVEGFEKVAERSVTNNLMKWSVKDYFLKAGICLLATGDMVAVRRAYEKYCDLDNSFSQTREYMLLVDLAGAVEEGDEEKFADCLFKYDQMSKLDKWKTTILLKVKESIVEKEEDFS